MNEFKLSFGANESKESVADIHAHQVFDMAVMPPQEVDKRPKYTIPHVNQNQVGICTAADLVNMAQQHYGKVFSMKFQYVGQKKVYDGNMDEGSSNVSALSFAKNYGFLPIEFDPEGNNTDVNYADFVNVSYTQAQFDEAKNYLLNGYAVAPLDPVGFMTALNNSQYGLMTRMAVGDNFYTPSWNKSDLELLRAPNKVISGHSAGVWWGKGLDVTTHLREIDNSWGGVGNPTLPDGTIWSGDGNIKYSYSTQQPYVTEAHVPIFGDFTLKHTFLVPILFGQTSSEVTALQRVLQVLGFFTLPQSVSYGYYGNVTKQAVVAFQKSKGIASGDGTSVGPLTRSALNSAQGLTN